jgi:GTPase
MKNNFTGTAISVYADWDKDESKYINVKYIVSPKCIDEDNFRISDELLNSVECKTAREAVDKARSYDDKIYHIGMLGTYSGLVKSGDIDSNEICHIDCILV